MPSSVKSRLRATRQQILAFRRRVGALDERMPNEHAVHCGARRGPAYRTACREPRCSHCTRGSRESSRRPRKTRRLPSYGALVTSTYIVTEARLRAVLAGKASRQRQEPASGRAAWLRGCTPILTATRDNLTVMPGSALGVGSNAIRYAATTGAIAIRWDGARAATISTVPARGDRPCRRASGAGSPLHPHFRTGDGSRIRALGRVLAEVSECTHFTSLEGSAPSGSSAARRRVVTCRRRARDSLARVDGRRARAPAAERRCLLSARRSRAGASRSAETISEQRLWTPRVWPGALLVEGEIRGTWRRAQHTRTRSTPGHVSHVGRATRSRPRRTPCPFQT